MGDQNAENLNRVPAESVDAHLASSRAVGARLLQQPCRALLGQRLASVPGARPLHVRAGTPAIGRAGVHHDALMRWENEKMEQARWFTISHWSMC